LRTTLHIDNDIYKHYGEGWYTDYDGPVAILRAESEAKTPWVIEQIRQLKNKTILDVGCGGGFLTNALGREGWQVTGVDISSECLVVASRHDETRSVVYVQASADKLPFRNGQFAVVTAMDFLEHVENPEHVIKEISRVLAPDGTFIFHTINRNIFTWLLIIKILPWLVKNTPKKMHLFRLFITPEELSRFCKFAGMRVRSMVGLRPVFSSIPISNYFTGVVPKNMQFKRIKSLVLSYMGTACKMDSELTP